MKFLSRSQSRKIGGRKSPDEIIRTFLRVLETLAPRANGGRAPAPTVLREKP